MRALSEATFRIKSFNDVIPIADIHAVMQGKQSNIFAVVETIHADVDGSVPWRGIHIANIAARYNIPEDSSALLLLIEYDLALIDQREPTERIFFYLEDDVLKIAGMEIEEDLLSSDDFVIGFEKGRGLAHNRPFGRIVISILPREEMALKLIAQ